MRVQYSNTIVVIGVVLCLLSCSKSPNEKANQLYVESNQIIQTMKTTGVDDHSKVYTSYKEAKQKIETILSKYPSSDLAVGLTSNKMKISGLTLNKFMEVESYFKYSFECKQDLMSCVVFLAENINDDSEKAFALAEIAVKYAELGQLSKALSIAENINRDGTKAWALQNIAAKYGKGEQREQILSKALSIAENINDGFRKAEALKNIAGKYAEAGQFTKALSIC